MPKKPPSFDLAALTTGQAVALPEAQQRTPFVVQPSTPAAEKPKTPSLEQLGFRVPSEFRTRFKQCALDAHLKLNELLVEALDAWEEKHGTKTSKRAG